MKKRLRWMGGMVVLSFAALQLINPSHRNPPVEAGHDLSASNAPPPAIAGMLKNSCYDCHSFETHWPWYSCVAPVSWFIARDVEAARASLNFSDWPHDEAGRVRKRWRHIADEIESGEMPVANYIRIHRDKALTEQQKAELVKWAKEQVEL